MNISVMRTFRLPLASLFVLAASLFLLPACTGGGGGGTGAAGITYTGVTTPASLTLANANIIFSAVWNLGSSSGSTGTVALAPSFYQANNDFASPGKRMGVRLPASTLSNNTNRATPINETSNGKISGSKTITGSIDPNTGKGTLDMTYVNYNDGNGTTLDGAVTLNIDQYDFAYDIITGATMNFTAWTIKTADSDVSISGSMRLQDDLHNNTETLTVNVDGRDNNSSETFRYENYAQTTVYDDLLNPASGSETYTGRMYVEKYGYVDISTISPCIYSGPQGDPDSGGPIVLAGAGNTRAKITPLSASYVKIEVDDNGDGVYEDRNAYTWINLGGTSVSSVCIAHAGPDQAAPAGSPVTLDGSGSMDLNGGPLTYAWTMTAKPVGSTAILSNPSQTTTSFTADLAGSYTITLEVSNGTTTSEPDIAVVMAGVPGSMGNGSGPSLAYITVTPGSPNIVKGTMQQFTAFGMYSDYTTKDLTQSVTWSSSDQTKLTINSLGLAQGIGVGSSTVTASLGKTARTCPVTVVIGFMPGVKYAAAPNTINLGNTAIGDLNGDGRNDVAVIDGFYGSRVMTYYQNAGGTLNQPQVIETGLVVTGVAVADVNNDGFADLIISGNSTTITTGFLGRIAVFSQDKTTHTLGRPQYYPLSVDNVGPLAVADLNGDGLADIVAAGLRGTNGIVSILFQDAGGALLPEFTYTNSPVFATTNSPVVADGELHIADMNNDGLNDIVLQSGEKQLAVVRQVAPGVFSNSPDFYTIPSSFRSFALGDLNGDGRIDVAVSAWDNSGYTIIFLQNSSGVLMESTLRTVPFIKQDEVHIADLDGNGLNDVIFLSNGYSVQVLYQIADHSFLNPFAYFLPTTSEGGTFIHQALSVGDVTGDGLPDIVSSWVDDGILVLPRLP